MMGRGVFTINIGCGFRSGGRRLASRRHVIIIRRWAAACRLRPGFALRRSALTAAAGRA
jgi:hypothetical protein